MGSLKSEGMIMCASNIDHTVVKIIVPPEGSKPGDRILFQGLPEGAALTPNQVMKSMHFDGFRELVANTYRTIPLRWKGKKC